MHKKAPQHASLAVLKSPDIPSILVETGFISNPREERLLKAPITKSVWQKRCLPQLKLLFTQPA